MTRERLLITHPVWIDSRLKLPLLFKGKKVRANCDAAQLGARLNKYCPVAGFVGT